jgi:hypothetical protein
VVERERYDASMLAVIPADGRRPWIELTDRESRKGKLIWSTDGRIVFYIANRTGIYNVWARRFDPEGGRALGTEFRVTAFQSARRMVLSDLSTSEIGIANEKLLVPVTDSTSRIWTLRRTP